MTNEEAIVFAAMTAHVWDNMEDTGATSPVYVAEQLVKLRRAGVTGRKLGEQLCNVPDCTDEVEGKYALLDLRIKKLCKSLNLTLVELQRDPRGAYIKVATNDGREYWC